MFSRGLSDGKGASGILIVIADGKPKTKCNWQWMDVQSILIGDKRCRNWEFGKEAAAMDNRVSRNILAFDFI